VTGLIKRVTHSEVKISDLEHQNQYWIAENIKLKKDITSIQHQQSKLVKNLFKLERMSESCQNETAHGFKLISSQLLHLRKENDMKVSVNHF